ncbi:MAG: glycerol-3-phosphate 1-O-acyltransferase PlsY [Lachnospira sp.]|nr:glycerol-3-phosphate 1-O-acyltransferase PlsY [Lachnospira sp.]
MERIICLVIGYLFGSILQTGYWYGKFNHIDIRQHGSGNAGTTNVMRTLGKKAGIITYLVDALKAIFAALIIHFIWGNSLDNEMLLFLYSGLGIVLGHNFPFYLGFKGGKGIAATSGVVMSLMLFPTHCWILTLAGVSTFAVVTIVSKYVSLGSLIAISGFFIEFVIMSLIGWIPLEGTALIEAYVLTFIIAALAFIRHAGNIQRLANGTERKIGQKKKTENEENK